MKKSTRKILAELDEIIELHDLRYPVPEPDLSDSNATKIAYRLIEGEMRWNLPFEFPVVLANAEPGSQTSHEETARELRKVHGLAFGWLEQWSKNVPPGMEILEDLTWLRLYRVAIWQMLESSRKHDEEETIAWIEISKALPSVFSFAPNFMRCLMAVAAWTTLYEASMMVYSKSASVRIRDACRDALKLFPTIDVEKVVAGEACFIREEIVKPQDPFPWEKPDPPKVFASRNLFKISHMARIVTQLQDIEPLPAKARASEELAAELLKQCNPDLDIDFFTMVMGTSQLVQGSFEFPAVISGILDHVEAGTVPPPSRFYRIKPIEAGYVIKLSSRIRRNYQITVTDHRTIEITGDQLSLTGKMRNRRSGS